MSHQVPWNDWVNTITSTTRQKCRDTRTLLSYDLLLPLIRVLIDFPRNSFKPTIQIEVFMNSSELFSLPVALECSFNYTNTFSGEYFDNLKIIEYNQVAYIHGLIISIAIPAKDSVNTRALQHERAMVHVILMLLHPLIYLHLTIQIMLDHVV